MTHDFAKNNWCIDYTDTVWQKMWTVCMFFILFNFFSGKKLINASTHPYVTHVFAASFNQ